MTEEESQLTVAGPELFELQVRVANLELMVIEKISQLKALINNRVDE